MSCRLPAALLAVLLAAACRTPAPRVDPSRVAAWQQDCRAIWRELLGREIEPAGLQGCVLQFRSGDSRAVIESRVKASPEYAAKHPDIPPPTRLRADGRYFVNDAGTYRPVWASELSILRRSAADRDARLDEVRALGFGGIRVFAGALAWANQSAAQAEKNLPALLEAAAARGLYVYVSAITDSKAGGYDVASHLKAIATICAQHDNAVLELANEVGHSTQDDDLTPARLRELAKLVPASVLYTLGSPVGQDEASSADRWPTRGGEFQDAHLDRSRSGWDNVRRLREIANLRSVLETPVMSGEPIGSAEQSKGHSRLHDPAWWFAYGALCRGLEIGCVFHSESGLQALPLGPHQKQDAQAVLDGWRSIDTDARLTFQNAGHSTSIVKSADFDEVVRVYSFISGANVWTVLVGVSGEQWPASPFLELRDGWKVGATVAERPGVRVIRLVKE